MKPVKIAVLTDMHMGDADSGSSRRCDIADIVLQRAVFRLNKLVRPDVTVVLGDVVNDGAAGRAPEDLRVMRAILDKLDSPYIAIPGNHDGDADQFYSAFDRPDPIVDIAGLRFLPFVDKGEPRYWASRSDRDLQRIREARDGYSGPIVSLQHVCLHDPDRGHVPPYYNYTNAAEVIRVMKESGVTLSISGHHHAGADDSRDGDLVFVNSPGLCEHPFPFLEVTVDGGRIETHRYELAMPRDLQLVDSHLHTHLAYCAENMDVAKSISLAHEFGMSRIIFTEHSGQLYFDKQPYWGNAWLEGLDSAEEKCDRMSQYLKLKDEFEDEFALFSLETECDKEGELLLKERDVGRFSFLMGTVHAVPGLGKDAPPTERECDECLRMVESLCKAGVSVLAHPLRTFGRLGWDVPEVLFDSTADLLARHGVAAELNFHSTHRPSPLFVRACLDRGVKFAFGSDSHNLAEIGDFAYQLALLKEVGFDGDLADVLWSPESH